MTEHKDQLLVEGQAMKCPRCGSNMVERLPAVIYLTNPPQWDSVMWCGCGYTESRGCVRGKTEKELQLDQWKRANQQRDKP